uniref:Retrovirus-related Pol polyprotein from transposon TNT 1-94-like beta-barrel domain-containing protein n=1 Tax=Opuntia streptacantha TaxID=393608 RepID=A0A7C9CXZ8_OPUST
MLQQEELQRQVLGNVSLDASALMSKNVTENRCTVCNNKGHTKEKCWQVIGYPNWHPRSKRNPQKKGGAARQNPQPHSAPGSQQAYGGRMRPSGQKNANQAETVESPVPGLTSYQIEQLLQLLPNSSSSHSPSTPSQVEDTDEELDYNFAGTATAICLHAEQKEVDWVIDTGATDHMTSVSTRLFTVTHKQTSLPNYYIKLPNGSQAPVTQIGDIQLCNGLTLKSTMVVPDFKYNLLSVNKLCKDNHCVAIFHPEICLLQDCATQQLKGIGEPRGGLYYLVNTPVAQVSPQLQRYRCCRW